MVILYIEKTKADETIWLKNPITNCKKITLNYCNFVNQLYNLEKEGTISDGQGNVLIRIPKGYYTLPSFKSALDKAVSIGKKPVSISESVLTPNVNIVLNDSLAKLLKLDPDLKKDSKNSINIVRACEFVYIHCSLVDPKQVLFNNNYSQLLAYVDLGSHNDRIQYKPFNTLYTPINDDYINSIRLWATDYNNNIIHSGIYPMKIVIEII
jgi:hypothetical protein